MLTFIKLDPSCTVDSIGFIPFFLNEDDPRPAKEQFNERYISGWVKFEGFTMLPDGTLLYPEDPPLKPLCECMFGDELIRIYKYGWVAIIQPDGTWEVCRMD